MKRILLAQIVFIKATFPEISPFPLITRSLSLVETIFMTHVLCFICQISFLVPQRYPFLCTIFIFTLCNYYEDSSNTGTLVVKHNSSRATLTPRNIVIYRAVFHTKIHCLLWRFTHDTVAFLFRISFFPVTSFLFPF